MPLTGVAYTKTGSFLPANATSPTYAWSITGGTINSGGTSSTVNYTFNTIGNQSLTLNATNSCSTKSDTRTYLICNPIVGFAISGSNSVVQNSSGTYTVGVTGGVPSGYNWFISGTGASITSGQGTNSVVIQFGSVGNASISVITTDCDNTVYTAAITVDQTGVSCTPLTSCSIS